MIGPSLLGLLEEFTPARGRLTNMVDDHALATNERRHATFQHFQAPGALAVDLESLDATVEQVIHFGLFLLVTDLNGCAHLLLCRRTLPVSVAGVFSWSLLLGLSSLVCSSV